MGDDRKDSAPELPPPPAVARTFTPLTAAQLDDPALLPRQFRFLQGRVDDLNELIRFQLVPMLQEFREMIAEVRADLREQRERVGALEDRSLELSAAMGVIR